MNNSRTARAHQEQASQLSGRTKVMSLDYKLAAILCYTPVLLISFIAPIIWLKTEPRENQQLRFHAIQGLGISVVALAFGILNSILMGILISIMGFGAVQLISLGSSLISLTFLGAMIYGIYCVVKDQPFRVPFIAEIADRNA